MTEPKPEYHAEAKWWHVTDQLAKDLGELRQAVTLLMQRVEALERRPSQRPASEVTLTIKDSSGNVVRRLTMDNVQAGLNSLTWDGKDSMGNTVEEGFYVVEAAALDGAGSAFTPSLSLVGTVESITYRDGAAYLKVRGVEISLGDVTAVGEPGAFDS